MLLLLFLSWNSFSMSSNCTLWLLVVLMAKLLFESESCCCCCCCSFKLLAVGSHSVSRPNVVRCEQAHVEWVRLLSTSLQPSCNQSLFKCVFVCVCVYFRIAELDWLVCAYSIEISIKYYDRWLSTYLVVGSQKTQRFGRNAWREFHPSGAMSWCLNTSSKGAFNATCNAWLLPLVDWPLVACL